MKKRTNLKRKIVAAFISLTLLQSGTAVFATPNSKDGATNEVLMSTYQDTIASLRHSIDDFASQLQKLKIQEGPIDKTQLSSLKVEFMKWIGGINKLVAELNDTEVVVKFLKNGSRSLDGIKEEVLKYGRTLLGKVESGESITSEDIDSLINRVVEIYFLIAGFHVFLEYWGWVAPEENVVSAPTQLVESC